MFGIDRTNSAINSDIRSSWGERMSAERGVSNINRQISLVESYQMPGAKRSAVSETADEKSSRLEAEKSLQESRISLMEEGLDKELATIRYGYQQKIDAVKGNSSAEMALRQSLLQEMNNELAKASEEYERIVQVLTFRIVLLPLRKVVRKKCPCVLRYLISRRKKK